MLNIVNLKNRKVTFCLSVSPGSVSPGSVWILVSDPPGLSPRVEVEQVMMSQTVGVPVGVMEGAGLWMTVWF